MAARNFLFPLLLICAVVAIVALSGCLSQTCSSDKNCKAWQACDSVKRTCVLKSGFCGADMECNDTLKICNTEHMCAFVPNRCRADPDCASWQTCNSEGNFTCKPKPGFCDSDSLCNPLTEVCSQTSHKCAPKPGNCRDPVSYTHLTLPTILRV